MNPYAIRSGPPEWWKATGDAEGAVREIREPGALSMRDVPDVLLVPKDEGGRGGLPIPKTLEEVGPWWDQVVFSDKGLDEATKAVWNGRSFIGIPPSAVTNNPAVLGRLEFELRRISTTVRGFGLIVQPRNKGGFSGRALRAESALRIRRGTQDPHDLILEKDRPELTTTEAIRRMRHFGGDLYTQQPLLSQKWMAALLARESGATQFTSSGSGAFGPLQQTMYWYAPNGVLKYSPFDWYASVRELCSWAGKRSLNTQAEQREAFNVYGGGEGWRKAKNRGDIEAWTEQGMRWLSRTLKAEGSGEAIVYSDTDWLSAVKDRLADAGAKLGFKA